MRDGLALVLLVGKATSPSWSSQPSSQETSKGEREKLGNPSRAKKGKQNISPGGIYLGKASRQCKMRCKSAFPKNQPSNWGPGVVTAAAPRRRASVLVELPPQVPPKSRRDVKVGAHRRTVEGALRAHQAVAELDDPSELLGDQGWRRHYQSSRVQRDRNWTRKLPSRSRRARRRLHNTVCSEGGGKPGSEKQKGTAFETK